MPQVGTQLPETRLNRLHMGPKSVRVIELPRVGKLVQEHILHHVWLEK